MKKKLFGLIASMALLGVSQAGATAFSVDLVSGTVSVTGTIVTDGKIGVLSAANIIDWNLLLSVGSSTVNLTGPKSGNNSSFSLSGSGNDFTSNPNSFGLQWNFFDSAIGGSATFGPTSGGGELQLFDANIKPPGGEIDVTISTSPLVAGVIPPPASDLVAVVPTSIIGTGIPGACLVFGGFVLWWRRRVTTLTHAA